MLKKIFISAVLLLAVLSFVVSMLKGNNNDEKTVTVPDRVAVINISGTISSGTDSNDNLFNQASGVTSGSIMKTRTCLCRKIHQREGIGCKG